MPVARLAQHKCLPDGQFHHAGFITVTGQRKTTVTATLIALKPGDPITIGIPLPNYNLAVVDEQLNLLPVGERGELVVTGPGLSKGYINLPELTAQKFVAKPAAMAALPGDTLYRMQAMPQSS